MIGPDPGQAARQFTPKLLEWWSKNKQQYSWRKTNDPYRTLVVELLLRKTTSKQVQRVYDIFIGKYPSSKELAKAPEKDLEKLLRPLGMEYTRAKLFKRLAEILVSDFSGHIPRSENDLEKLPGVGRYSVNAVLCMAYGKDVPMVDTNAVRVVNRVFDFRSSKARAKDDPEIWNFVKGLIPSGKAKEFNLAIIDFAHSICLPRVPLCPKCPEKSMCEYNLQK